MKKGHCIFVLFVVRHILFDVQRTDQCYVNSSSVTLVFFCLSLFLYFPPSVSLQCEIYLRIFTCSLLLAVSPLSHNPRYTSLYTTILMTAAVFCHSQVDPWAFHRLEERQRKYIDSASASCHIDGHRYKQGWDHYVDARGLRSHRLAVTTSCIQWNIAVWYTSEKRKKIEKKRGWNYSVDCGQLKGTRERDSYLFLPIRTVCILLRLCAPSVRLFLSWYLFDRIAPFYSIPFNCFLFSTTFLLLPMCTAHIHVLT